MVKVEKRSDLKPETFYWLKDTTGKMHDMFKLHICKTQDVLDDDWVDGSDEFPDGLGFNILGYVDSYKYWDEMVKQGYEFYEAVLP